MNSIFQFFHCISSNHLKLSIDLVRTELVPAHHAGRVYDRSWGNGQCRRGGGFRRHCCCCHQCYCCEPLGAVALQKVTDLFLGRFRPAIRSDTTLPALTHRPVVTILASGIGHRASGIGHRASGSAVIVGAEWALHSVRGAMEPAYGTFDSPTEGLLRNLWPPTQRGVFPGVFPGTVHPFL
jgi:hypothetical protein